MRELHVSGGELEGQGSWVHAWLAGDGVVFVGGTGLHPETRTWLQHPETDRFVDAIEASLR